MLIIAAVSGTAKEIKIEMYSREALEKKVKQLKIWPLKQCHSQHQNSIINNGNQKIRLLIISNRNLNYFCYKLFQR